MGFRACRVNRVYGVRGFFRLAQTRECGAECSAIHIYIYVYMYIHICTYIDTDIHTHCSLYTDM